MDPMTPFNNVAVHHPKLENQNASVDSDNNWSSYFDDYYTSLMPTWEEEGVFCESSNILGDLDNMCGGGDLNVWDYDEPLSAIMFQENGGHFDDEETNNSNNDEARMKKKKRNNKKAGGLEFDEIQKYFDVPITKAAKELKVGLTALKKRCRELNISRWPHRKIKSLTSLIHNIKELGMGNEISMVEEQKRMVECIPEMDLTEKTKKLRQACFKANYKRRRATLPAPSPH